VKNFNTDLQRGKLGEKEICKLFAGLKLTDGKKGDFLLANGEKLELKTDFYDHSKTQNFFIERYSSISTLSPGGPWQAQAHGCDYFLYYFAAQRMGYLFRTNVLVSALDKLLQETNYPQTEVRNRKWTTVGYRVPRADLVPELTFCGAIYLGGNSVLWGLLHGAK
jgi:hypothetical protein